MKPLGQDRMPLTSLSPVFYAKNVKSRTKTPNAREENPMKVTELRILKRQEAEKRQAERDKRTPQEQIDLLDKSFGKGVGAKKERAKLAKLIDAQK